MGNIASAGGEESDLLCLDMASVGRFLERFQNFGLCWLGLSCIYLTLVGLAVDGGGLAIMTVA